ncbi:uncharacterized protein KY384_009037 [Bacidia gigantensis]|uniref:uncharacterized protein n=1 Tax=Bacidia gigantensis TaxID=2732470 RepID=UPI001D037431|nr:uncharacterized protein KY384_009037 [Bacidia gigantensis]KAG8525393.1 hypothetical protein KY384_009037 [Bacidia gigantensis]
MADLKLGNYLRLRLLHINELPSHAGLESSIENPEADQGPIDRPSLHVFITSILEEAYHFTKANVSQFTSHGSKKSPPSTSPVELLTQSYSRELEHVSWQDPKLPRKWSGHGPANAEHWFARRSHHTNSSEEGTATLSEFDYGTRRDHPEREKDYTPDLYDCAEILNYNDQIHEEFGFEGKLSSTSGEFTDVQMSVQEMCHQLPFGLYNRCFSVLVITAKGPLQDELLVVQLPVDISSFTAAFYSNKRNLKEGKDKLQKKQVILGMYVSVERVRILSDSNIEWLMATASDAKGWLPMWMQRLGVPGAVVKDVGLLMEWIKKPRQQGLIKD